MAKIGLPKGSGKGLKVREKSGNFEMDIEWQPWVQVAQENHMLSTCFVNLSQDVPYNLFLVIRQLLL